MYLCMPCISFHMKAHLSILLVDTQMYAKYERHRVDFKRDSSHCWSQVEFQRSRHRQLKEMTI